MNKKGFTLIEIIAAVLIMLAIIMIVVPNFRSILSRNTNKLWKENENRLEEAAKKYLVEQDITVEIGNTLTITKQQLINAHLIKELYNLNDKSVVCDAHVDIYNNSGKYEATADISCPNGYHTS